MPLTGCQEGGQAVPLVFDGDPCKGGCLASPPLHLCTPPSALGLLGNAFPLALCYAQQAAEVLFLMLASSTCMSLGRRPIPRFWSSCASAALGLGWFPHLLSSKRCTS